jgi:hypothetical protein
MSWGPPTWIFIHALCEKINPVHYLLVKDALWNHLKELCANLPCPDCSQHATSYLSKLSTPPTKMHLIQVMHTFHNVVNQNTGKPPFPVERLTQYRNVPFPVLFSLYKKANTNQQYNPKLMMHKMRSRQFLQRFQGWLQQQQLLQP